MITYDEFGNLISSEPTFNGVPVAQMRGSAIAGTTGPAGTTGSQGGAYGISRVSGSYGGSGGFNPANANTTQSLQQAMQRAGQSSSILGNVSGNTQVIENGYLYMPGGSSSGVSKTYDSGDKYGGILPAPNLAPDYTLYYEPTQIGQAYEKAMMKITDDLGKTPTYNNKYDIQLENAYNSIVNRDPFRWEADTDPFYQQYKKRYTQLGQQAMKDTMGQAAALTGGYASSYGQFAGQSAYNQYMQALEDRAIELEERAYDRWRDAGDELYKQYALLGDLRDNEYGRYRDAVSDYNYSLALAQAQEAEDYARKKYANDLRIAAEQEGYNRNRDAISDARYEDELRYARWRDQISDYRYDDETAYNRSRDSVADSQWQAEMDYKYATLAAQEAAAAAKASSSGSSGGSSGGGSGYSGYSGNSYSYSEPVASYTPAATTQPTETWGFREVAGAVDKAISSGWSNTQINKALNEEVQAGTITNEDKRYIKKDLQVRDRL